jgi:translocator protein
MIQRLLLFGLLNFGALAIGGLFTGPGVSSDWYQGLNKAPWTPPGWVFGAAWSTIMICFTIFMDLTFPKIENKTMFIGLYALQLILNIAWNPVFFKFQNTLLGLILISSLMILVAYFLFGYLKDFKLTSLLVLPYFLWLVIATSLNAFILFKN